MAVLLFGVGVWAVLSVGVEWWTVIWFPVAVAEWFNWLSPSRFITRFWFQRNPKFREEYHLSFLPENIHFKTASIDSALQWSQYERVIESPNAFLLLYGKGPFMVLPKRAFNSAEDLAAFRELAREKIASYTFSRQ